MLARLGAPKLRDTGLIYRCVKGVNIGAAEAKRMNNVMVPGPFRFLC